MITKLIADALVRKFPTFYRKDLKIDNVDVFIYNYLLSDQEAFCDKYGTELRGLTITHESGKETVFLSCPKFFNINETPDTLESVLNTKIIKKITEKADGSLIQPILINGDIQMKTKQSFTNKQAKLAQNILDTSADLKYFIMDCFDNNFHPLFELKGPSNRIVVDYPEDELVLIMLRNEIGEFIDISKTDYKYQVKSYNKTLKQIIHDAKNLIDFEGYVIKFTDGTIIKVKTIDYITKHRVVSESESYKSLLRLILEENIDDTLQLVSPNKQEEILKLQKSIVDYTVHYIKQITELIHHNKLTRKEFAIKHKEHLYFNVLMGCLNNPEGVKENLIKQILKKHNKENQAKTFIDIIN